MRFSDDGKTLLKVTNADLKNGTLFIPEGVTIGESAFYGCTDLTAVTIPEGVTIGRYAFYSCTNLTEVTIAERVTIGQGVFYGCTALTVVSIAEGVTIGWSAFYSCTGLSEIIIPKRGYIGKAAFKDCTGLSKVSIAEGGNIAKAVFLSYTGLTEVIIPEGITIGQNAFADCSSLNRMVVNTKDAKEIERIKDSLPNNLKNLVIPNPVWDKVQLAQHHARKKITNDPRMSSLFGVYDALGLVEDVLTIITSFEGPNNIALQQVAAAIRALPIPTSEEGLLHYQYTLHEKVEEIKNHCIVQASKEHCAHKLENHITYLKTLIVQKEARKPGFFKSEPDLHKNLNAKIGAVMALIDYLRGDESVSFSQADKDILSSGILGKTLLKLSIRLDELPMNHPQCTAKKSHDDTV